MVTHDVAHPGPTSEHTSRLTLDKRLETFGWALVFVWLGASFLIGFPWQAVLIGLGVIALGMQGVRVYAQLPVEGYWLIVGAMFAAAGLWVLFAAVSAVVVPIALIAAGLVLITSVFWPGQTGAE